MGILGKIFAILVVLLSIAVAVLSWKLSEHRRVFRGHSEALAEGLKRVATEVGGMDALPVDDSLRAVTFRKASPGGKDEGTLGFEEYKRNPNSVSTAVTALLEGLKARQEQTAMFAASLQGLGTLMGIAQSGVTSEALLTGGEHEKLLKNLTQHAHKIQNRDKALCNRLSQMAQELGVRRTEISASRYASASQEHGKFTVEKFFDEVEIALQLTDAQREAFQKSMQDFRNAVGAYQDWRSDFRSVDVLTTGYQEASKATDEEGTRSRKAYMKNLNDMFAAFVRDGSGLNDAMLNLQRDKKRLEGQTNTMKRTVSEVQEKLDAVNARLAEMEQENRKLQEVNAWAKRSLEALQQAKALNAPAADPLSEKVITELKEIRSDVQCDVRMIEKEQRFLIISGTNRQLCPGAKMIILSDAKASDGPVRLLVKECSDYMSMAYVISGDLDGIQVGDPVVLSVDHGEIVQKVEDDKRAAEEAKIRAAREAEIKRSRENIERREAAEKKQENGMFLGL